MGRVGGGKNRPSVDQSTIQDMMHDRLRELGYSDMMGFYKGSGLSGHLAYETVRRCFISRQTMAPLTIGLVMRFLQFTSAEIVQTMRALGDDAYYLLVSEDADSRLELWESGVVSLCRRLAGLDIRNIEAIQAALRGLAVVGGMVEECSNDLNRVIVPRGKKKGFSVSLPGVKAEKAAKAKTKSTVQAGSEQEEPIRKITVPAHLQHGGEPSQEQGQDTIPSVTRGPGGRFVKINQGGN